MPRSIEHCDEKWAPVFGSSNATTNEHCDEKWAPVFGSSNATTNEHCDKKWAPVFGRSNATTDEQHWKALTILRDRTPAPDPQALALSTLGWLLSDEDRASRFLVMTGLTTDDLRASLDQQATLVAVLDFLCAHEPDLVSAAEALGQPPESLVAARHTLAGESFE